MSVFTLGRFARFYGRNKTIAYTAIRSHWNKDFKPGPYPITEEEKLAAAKKYGILREEYEAYPDDGYGSGDYPKLPDISGESKDPYYPWDFPELKRNFNEPLHLQFDMIGEDRVDISPNRRFPDWYYFATFFGTISVFFVIYYASMYIKIFPGVASKQLPLDGKVHYTFEPKEAHGGK